jgi:hypothetical protein
VTTDTSERPPRVGILSPNILLNVADHNAAVDDPNLPWRFDSIAKKAALLFDKVYLTHDLDTTCALIGNAEYEGVNSGTFRYLIDRKFIITPQDLGYLSGDELIGANLCGAAAKIDAELHRVGNPGMDGDEDYLIGQPDVGDFAESNGCHPRGGDKRLRRIAERAYESLLLRRNAEILRNAGLADVAVVGRLFEEPCEDACMNPVWKVVIREIPQLDTGIPWPDVLDFRADERTQHLARRLRRWVRKIVTESWSEAELEDEVRESVYEYETHLQVARMSANKGFLEILITGTADLAEDILKLRISKVAKIVSVVRERKVKLLREELNAPGREVALLSELKRRGILP